VVSQQVSVASAAAIHGRMLAAGLTDPAALVLATDETLRAAGLSRQKIRYLRGLAAADLDYAALRAAPDAEVIARLVALLAGSGDASPAGLMFLGLGLIGLRDRIERGFRGDD